MYPPVHVGKDVPPQFRPVVQSFVSLSFSVACEFWLLHWKNQIRVRFTNLDDVNASTVFERQLREQLPQHLIRRTVLGWHIGRLPKEHPLSDWGIEYL
jgi:hypothetical protein